MKVLYPLYARTDLWCFIKLYTKTSTLLLIVVYSILYYIA